MGGARFYSPSTLLSVVDRCDKSVDRCADNVRIHACAPGERAVRLADSHIGDRLGTGTLLQSVLLVSYQIVLQAVSLLERIADSVQASVSGSFGYSFS